MRKEKNMGCQKNAFTDSAFLEQPFINGVKMAGSIVAAIDYDADEVVFPDEEKPVTGFAYGIDLGRVKKLMIPRAALACTRRRRGFILPRTRPTTLRPTDN